MEKDLFSDIIQVEKEIQEKIALEKQKALEIIRLAEQEGEDAIRKEETRLQLEMKSAIERAKKEAERKAGNTVRHAENLARKLDLIDEAHVANVLMGHLKRILPGNP